MKNMEYKEVQESILSLQDADSLFQSKGGPQAVDTMLKNLIIESGLASHFGVILVHRHTQIDPGQVMVDYNNCSSPWPLDTIGNGCGSVLPQSWMSRNSDIIPYEYCFVTPKQEMSELDAKFVTRFFEIFEKWGLSECVGLRRVPQGGEEFLEITRGSTNIMIPSKELPTGMMDVNTTDTMWFFDSKNGFKKYRCACRDTGSSTNPNHNHIDG